MYAIIQTGGKQYRVQPGDRLKVEKLADALGAEVKLTDVLMIGGEATHVGQPLVKNAIVTVVVTKQTKDKKVIVFKKNRRKGYRRFKTHRQPYTELFVSSITTPDGKVTKADTSARVLDIDQMRLDRVEAKVAAKNEVREDKGKREEKKAAKTVAKKVVKKAAPKKTAKKVAKKGGAKKKTAKKTAKKA